MHLCLHVHRNLHLHLHLHACVHMHVARGFAACSDIYARTAGRGARGAGTTELRGFGMAEKNSWVDERGEAYADGDVFHDGGEHTLVCVCVCV